MDYQFSCITKLCVCGVEFHPHSRRQKYHARDCSHRATNNKSRATKRANHRINFIGVDGEGVNIVHPNGYKEHRYVMLSVGDETLWNNGQELTHHDILPFLYEQYLASPDSAFVGFYLTYDFTMWLKSLTENRALMLFSPAYVAKRKRRGANPVPFPVYVDGWELDMLGTRRLKLRPAVDEGEKNTHGWLYVCDAGSYFQTSFLNVIEPTEKKWAHGTAPCSWEEYNTIKTGKENRSTEVAPDDVSYLPDMRRYNILENRILSATMSVLNDGFLAAGVRIQKSNFYGPGQAIQLYLDHLVKQGAYLPHKYLEEDLPAWVTDAFQASYYGGRFEQPYHGHLPGPTYEYDITSAYPHAMRNLPCLCSNNWTRGTDNEPYNATILLLKAHVRGSSQSMGPLPFRNPKGNILYPNETRGWYLWSEIEAAHRAGLVDEYSVDEWIAFNQTCDHRPPLASLADLFTQRLNVGKATAHGKAIKLMLNSAYGKFAQSVGMPKYGNPIYASMITSDCRRMILDAIATHPVGADHVVMVATDGIYFRSHHPVFDALPDKEQLGGWEPGIKTNVCLMKPGVYWDDTSRDAIRNQTIAGIKSRGISAKVLADNIDRIDAAFHEYPQTREMPSLSVAINFSMTTPALALARGKWHTAGRITWSDTRTESASLAPKRRDAYLDGPYIRSYPMRVPPGTETTPYDKRFGFNDREPIIGTDQEGNLDDVIRDLLPQ